MNRLEVMEVNKTFGKNQILNRVSFSCKTGEIIGLFGRNGSGKSTLLRGIMGTLSMDSITIYINGDNIQTPKIFPKQLIGFLPQDSFLPKEMKVRDVIPLMFPDGDEQDKIFHSDGVAAFDSRRIGKLSAGQLKYLELVLLAQLPQPFLLLDEPFSMLEPMYIERVKKLLLSLKATKGLVITDHYYRDVLEIADRSLVLKAGRAFEVENEQDLARHEYLKT
ncbi:ATP-binding cassette domain-containing protein [Salinimicrobium xinjiangense]|uniref:ATP-binding cassette domain-containing protein n=1 Tax=Salinimicrobium xinjiangense TaxID=438596 RepID=UPI000415D000|nr:ATP-binding cassette domain-containing protein [Salinimicrobium xinjiangense]